MTLSNIGITVGNADNLLIDRVGTTGYPVSKMMLGSESANHGLVHRDNPIPIQDKLSIHRQIISGYSHIHKFGKNTNLGSSEEYIWSAGGNYHFPTGALAIRVASGGHVADASGSAGANTIVVQGLNSSWQLQTETLALSGTGQSAESTGTFIRVFRAYTDEIGLYDGTNSGDIRIEQTDGNQLAQIDAARGQTQMAIYTVPSGFTAYVDGVSLFADTRANKTITTRLEQRQEAHRTTAPFKGARTVHEFSNVQGSIHLSDWYSDHPEMTDLYFIGSGESENSSLHVHFDIVLKEN
jgi:hypothetical protein